MGSTISAGTSRGSHATAADGSAHAGWVVLIDQPRIKKAGVRRLRIIGAVRAVSAGVNPSMLLSFGLRASGHTDEPAPQLELCHGGRGRQKF